MAEKTLNVRIRNKYDSYERWAQSNLVLNEGEIAVAYTTVNVTLDNGTIEQHPALLMKVGDGTKTFANLPWLSARAADVPAWAKAANPPTYAASDITGIDAYIADYVNDQMGISVDTDTQYQFVKVNDYQYKLQQKGKTDSAWADVTGSVIDIPNDTEELAALRTLLGGADALPVSTQIDNKITALNLSTTYVTLGAFNNITGGLREDVNLYKSIIGNMGSLTTTEKGNLVGAMNELVAVDKAINDKIGTVATGKTVVQMITEAQTAATYDDTQVKADIKANTDAIDAIEQDYLKAADKQELQGNINTEKGRIDTLVGTDTGKSARTIANEELAKQLIPAGAQESLDTLAEIAAWIQDHPEDASAMNEAITALQNQLTGIAAGNGTVKKYVDDAISALKIGDYAKAADLTALAGRVTTLEGNVATWNAAEQNAKDYADGLNTDMDTRVKVVEGKAHEHDNKALLDTYTQTEANLAEAVAKKHEHENKTVLDGITSAKVAAWDAAEQNAKDHADDIKDELIGTSDDAKTANTIYGVKKYVDEEVSSIESIVQMTYVYSVDAGDGLKATPRHDANMGINYTISFDDMVTFILDCGDSGVATA